MHPVNIEFDESEFDPLRIQSITHDLMQHPLLEMSSIVALGKRLAARDSVRLHNDKASPGTSFVAAPDTHPVHRSAEEVLEDIENAGAWMSLQNVQRDAVYRELVDDVLDAVEPRVSRRDPGMHHRGAWIFVTSPNAVTPYHMDHENSFVLHVRGEKTFRIWDSMDREVVTERCLELFHHRYSRELVAYEDSFDRKAHRFEMKPGDGAYMPVTSPHWVKNGNTVSVTVSFTYHTVESRRRELLYKGNCVLRERGLAPPAVGASPVRDAVLEGALRVARVGRQAMKKALGRPYFEQNLRYAPGVTAASY